MVMTCCGAPIGANREGGPKEGAIGSSDCPQCIGTFRVLEEICQANLHISLTPVLKSSKMLSALTGSVAPATIPIPYTSGGNRSESSNLTAGAIESFLQCCTGVCLVVTTFSNTYRYIEKKQLSNQLHGKSLHFACTTRATVKSVCRRKVSTFRHIL